MEEPTRDGIVALENACVSIGCGASDPALLDTVERLSGVVTAAEATHALAELLRFFSVAKVQHPHVSTTLTAAVRALTERVSVCDVLDSRAMRSVETCESMLRLRLCYPGAYAVLRERISRETGVPWHAEDGPAHELPPSVLRTLAGLTVSQRWGVLRVLEAGRDV